MQNYRIKTNAVEEGERESELVDLVQNSATNLDDGELRRLGGMRRGAEYAEIALYFTLGANGIKKTSDCVLARGLATMTHGPS